MITTTKTTFVISAIPVRITNNTVELDSVLFVVCTMLEVPDIVRL